MATHFFRRLCLLILFVGSLTSQAFAQFFSPIDQKTALAIGIKVWANESNNSIEGLTAWNKGESFASVGIGHFLWWPNDNMKNEDQTFPLLLRYIEDQGITVPRWLEGEQVPPCPWPNRTFFNYSKNSQKMQELRVFLARTIGIQSQFMVIQLEHGIEKMLASASPYDRQYLTDTLNAIAREPNGLYILVDYVNFKGIGISSYLSNTFGWGLMPVLLNMKNAPFNLTPAQAMAWSANQLLTRRAVISRNPQTKVWLNGWRKRLESYY